MTNPQALRFCEDAFRNVATHVLSDYENYLKKQGLSESEAVERLCVYRAQMEGWLKRSIDAAKRRFPVH
ncbi:hypothetical protein X771_08440 [Mesorhizobium sp. LSJC277A00]|nr:hypothetical protein X771_08440 [Mesorhizobium sp. LSJC277A00]